MKFRFDTVKITDVLRFIIVFIEKNEINKINNDNLLTVLLARFLTLQLRYAVFPRGAVTFLDAALSKYGRSGFPENSPKPFWCLFDLLNRHCDTSENHDKHICSLHAQNEIFPAIAFSTLKRIVHCSCYATRFEATSDTFPRVQCYTVHDIYIL